MSEALSSSEIEDVLSSIRRLVSDDLRPTTGARPVLQPVSDGNKLLLTPALRVVQGEDAAAADQPRAIDDVLAAVSAGVAQQPDDWESETGDAPVEAPMAENVEEIWQDAPPVAAYAEAVIAVDPAVEVVAEILPEPAAEQAEAAVEGWLEMVAEVSSVEGDAAPAAGEEASLPGWAQVAPPEEDDIPRPDPLSGGTLEPDRAWADQAEAAALQELEAAPHRPAAEDDLAEDDLPDLPVDEAMLREIVRDVLREELQGPLGERITRNIRKLVRAEIARVMATEQLM